MWISLYGTFYTQINNIVKRKSISIDKRVVEFINYIYKAYPEEINQLYDERDKWISEYVNNNFREPVEDRDHEILSHKEIKLLYL